MTFAECEPELDELNKEFDRLNDYYTRKANHPLLGTIWLFLPASRRIMKRMGEIVDRERYLLDHMDPVPVSTQAPDCNLQI